MGENAERLKTLNEEMLVSRRRIEEKYENKTFLRGKVHKIRFSVRSSRAKFLLVNVSLHYCSRFMCHPAPVQSFFVVYVNASFMTIIFYIYRDYSIKYIHISFNNLCHHESETFQSQYVMLSHLTF